MCITIAFVIKTGDQTVFTEQSVEDYEKFVDDILSTSDADDKTMTIVSLTKIGEEKELCLFMTFKGDSDDEIETPKGYRDVQYWEVTRQTDMVADINGQVWIEMSVAQQKSMHIRKVIRNIKGETR